MRDRVTFRRWLAPVGFMAALLVVSAQRRVPVPEDVSDKVLHAVAYGILTALLLFAMRPVEWRRAASAFLIAAGYGAVLELVQTLLPGRYPSVGDALANGAGSLAAIAIFGMTKWVTVNRGDAS